MATIALNERDKLLDLTSPRVIDVNNLEITLTASSPIFKFIDDEPTTAASYDIIINAHMQMSGTPVWTVVGGPVTGITLTPSGASATVSALGSMPESVEINVSVVSTLYTKTYTKSITLSRVNDGMIGINGTRTAVLDLYKWSSTYPTAPSGSSVFTWATGQFTLPATPNGWAVVPGTGAPGDKLYIARQFYGDSGTSLTSSVTWSSPSIKEIGVYSEDGKSVAYLEVYQYAATQPTTFPSGTSTYTWATGAFTAPTTAAGWSILPGNGDPGETLWACQVRLVSVITTPTVSVTWNTSTAYPVGANGDEGLDAPLLYLSGDGVVFLYKDVESTTTDSPSITLTAKIQNVVGSPTFVARAFNKLGIDLGAITLTGSGNSRVLTPTNFLQYGITTSTVVITCTLGSLTDILTIYRGNDGADSIILWLQNEAHIVPASETGVVAQWDGANTNIKVFKGFVDDTSNWTLSRVNNNTTSSLTGSGTSTPYLTVTGMSNDVGTVDITATKGSSTIQKTFSVSKSRAGIQAPLLYLAASGLAFIYPDATSTTSLSPTISLTINTQNIVDTSGLTTVATAYNSAGTSLGTVTLGGTGVNRTMSPAQFLTYSTTSYVKVVSTINTLTDTVTIYRGNGGSDALNMLMSNESHMVPADSSGVVQQWAGAGSLVAVFKGTDLAPATYTFTTAQTGGITYTPTGSIPNANQITLSATAMTSDSGTITVTATSGTTVLTKVFTLTKSKQGTAGVGGASVDIIYSRQPATPTPTTPSPSPGVPTVPASTWYTDISSVPAGTNPIWQCTGRKTPPATDFTWDTPKIVSGTSIVELTIFIRSASAPPTLLTPVGGTYNFATRVLTPPTTAPGTWSTTFPTGGVGASPVYTARASVSTNDPTQTAVAVTGWSTPTLTVQNGEQGLQGNQGLPGSDASVTVANIKSAIEAGSSTTINLANHSEFFKSSSQANTGVFIGAGGIYGKASGVTTFAIDGAQGNAQFSGTILLGAEASGIRSGLDFKNSGTVYGSLYYNATPVGDIGKGMVLSTASDTISSSAILEAKNNTGSKAVLQLTNQLGVQGSLILDSPGSSFLIQSVGSSLQVASVGGNLALNSNLSFGQFSILSSNFKIQEASPATFEFIGTSPILKLDRSGSSPWLIKHEAGNLVVDFDVSPINDFVFSSDGNFVARGNVTAYSDKRIKANIKPITTALSKLKQINGYQYKNLLANKHDCGIIAQEIEKILPELVQVSSQQFEGIEIKTVNYNGVVALLVAANRELIARVETLEKKVHGLTVNRSNKSS